MWPFRAYIYDDVGGPSIWSISDQFYFVSNSSVFFAGCALLFLAASGNKLLAFVPLLGLMGYAIWLFANVGDYEYAGVGELFAIFALAATLVAAGIWVLLTRIAAKFLAQRFTLALPRYLSRTLSILAAISPAITAATVSYDMQNVPLAACSTDGVTFVVGETSYFVPREFHAWVKVEEQPDRNFPYYTAYSELTRDKEDVKWICTATANGEKPLHVVELKLSLTRVAAFLNATCVTDQGQTMSPCPGYSPPLLENIRSVVVAETPDRMVSNTQAWHSKRRSDVTAGGDLTDGFVCIEETYNNSHQCSSWRPIDRKSFVFAKTQRLPGRQPEELMHDLDAAIAFLQAALTPEPSE